ncbi:MAG: class I SAM-dependent methyltransferase [Acidobacteria bacterium]|nr:MAG: class I SAM-dependent methyltransferase [Acidobacteriota bacterium]
MTLYDRYVLPHLIEFAMSRDEATRLRRTYIPRARGIVLEIGIGSGLNLPFYTKDVTRLYGVDPSAELLAMARARAASASFPVELLNQSAERLPLAEGSIDTVVVTWSLCSVADPVAALGEIRRVLTPDGTFIFVEHGLAPDAGVQKWQNRLTPAWRRVAGGCRLNRPMAAMIRDAGFTIADLRTEYVPGPRPMTFMYEGTAHADDSTRDRG